MQKKRKDVFVNNYFLGVLTSSFVALIGFLINELLIKPTKEYNEIMFVVESKYHFYANLLNNPAFAYDIKPGDNGWDERDEASIEIRKVSCDLHSYLNNRYPFFHYGMLSKNDIEKLCGDLMLLSNIVCLIANNNNEVKSKNYDMIIKADREIQDIFRKNNIKRK